jgi:hypothetical protein
VIGRLGHRRERGAGAREREEGRSGPEAAQPRGVSLFFFFLFYFLFLSSIFYFFISFSFEQINS